MDTLNGKDTSKCTKDEAIRFCHENRDEYIRQSDDIDDGVRQFDCLIGIIEGGTIPVTDLPEYGMSDKELEVKQDMLGFEGTDDGLKKLEI